MPGELERASEIRQLVEEQLVDDVYSITGNHRDRIGDARTGWVSHYDPRGDEEEFGLWPSRSEEQLALEAGLAPYLDQLPVELRVIIRLYYDARMTVREIADQTGMRHPTPVRRLRDAHARVRELLEQAFLQEEHVQRS